MVKQAGATDARPDEEYGCEDDPRLAFVKSRPVRAVIVGGKAPNQDGLLSEGFGVVRAVMDALIEEGHPLELIKDIFTETDFAIGNCVRRRCDWAKEIPARDAAVRKFVEDGYRKLIAARNQHKVAEAELTAADLPKPEFFLLGDFDEATLPKRDWIIDGIFERANMSVLAGQGGTVKSTMTIFLALCAATGKRVGPFRPTGKYRVGMVNAEDDLTEQRRRTAALLKTEDLASIGNRRDLIDDLHIHTLKCDVTALAAFDPDSKKIVPTDTYRWLASEIKRLALDIIFIDPLVEVCEGINENDNSQMHGVMALLRTLARSLGVHVCIVHHFNKPGSADSAGAVRGGSAIVNSARMNLNLEKANDKDCAELGITEEDRHSRIKMVIPKANNSATGAVHWFEIIPMELANGDTVAAVQAWTPEPFEISTETVLEFLDLIEAGRLDKGGKPTGDPFSDAGRGPKPARADQLLVGLGLGARQARRLIERLIGNGYLARMTFTAGNRHSVTGLKVQRRPGPNQDWDADPFVTQREAAE